MILRTDRLQTLEAVRAAAALMVVMFHTQLVIGTRTGQTVFAGAFANGDKGVDLFFVLSGCVMTWAHRADVGRAKMFARYAYSRLCRVYPLMWCVSAAALALYSAGFGSDKSNKLEMAPLISSFLLLPQSGDALVNVTWTLVHETFFYALFGVLVLHRRLGLMVLGTWQGAILVMAVIGTDTSSVWGTYLRPIALEFGLGMLAAVLGIRLCERHGDAARLSGWAFLSLGSVGLVACMLCDGYMFGQQNGLHRVAAFGIPAGIIILGCILLEAGRTVRISPIVSLLGRASYAIYLVHFSIITITVTGLIALRVPPVGVWAPIAIAATGIGGGLVFHQIVERPLGRAVGAWRRRLFADSRAAPHSVPQVYPIH